MKRHRQKQKVIDSKPVAPKTRTHDAFTNTMARLGNGQTNLLEGTDYVLTRDVTRNFQRLNAMYRGHWIVRKIIDTIPEDMTKNWYRLKTQVKPELIDAFERMEESTNVKEKICEGLSWGRLYGGAGAVMLIDGQQDIMDKPLDYDTIMPKAFKGLLVLDRWTGIVPDTSQLVDDINDPEYGLPEFYTLTTQGGQVFRVHHSRVLRFIGGKLPYLERIAEMYWGVSEVEIIMEELKKRDNTSWNIANLIFLANLRVLKMADLGETLAIGTEQQQQDVYNTAAAQNALMSNQGMMMLGEKDEFETHQYQFSGVDKVYENFMCDLAGACGIPVTKLFGRAPAGMDATGESDSQNYDGTIEQKQGAQLRPILRKLVPVMCVSEWGFIPDDLNYGFNPVRQPKPADLALLAKNLTDNVITTYQAGLISQQTALKELRQQADVTGQFSNITDEDIENADDTTNQGEMMPPGTNPFGEGNPDSKPPEEESV